MRITGRDLIVYILENNLEDVHISLNAGFLPLITIEEAASNLGVGQATVRAWFDLKMLDGIKSGNRIYITRNDKFYRLSAKKYTDTNYHKNGGKN